MEETTVVSSGEKEKNLATLVGTIVSRRCMGKSLAFANLQIEEGTTQVKWERTRVQSVAFPTKPSMLPLGGRIEATVLCRLHQRLVVTWELLNDPKVEALEAATNTAGAISNSEYLRRRFLNHTLSAPKMVSKPLRDNRAGEHKQPNGNTHFAPRSHVIFSEWLVEQGLIDPATDRVLDVAGGKGRLAVELARLGVKSCTVLDPVQRKPCRVKKLVHPPQFIYSTFHRPGHPKFEGIRELVQHSSVLVGLHPDECTEDIVEAALRLGKAMAVVPCCVFPDLFDIRRIGQAPVRTYDDFLTYLLAKDSRLQSATLPFTGKNVCVYFRP